MEVYKKYKPRPKDGPNVMARPVTFLPLPTTVRSLYGRFVLRNTAGLYYGTCGFVQTVFQNV